MDMFAVVQYFTFMVICFVGLIWMKVNKDDYFDVVDIILITILSLVPFVNAVFGLMAVIQWLGTKGYKPLEYKLWEKK